MSLFGHTKQYHALCLAHLNFDAKVNKSSSAIVMCNEIKKYLSEGIRNGEVRPLPYEVFVRDRCEEAFRFMANGRHIGKVLIRLRGEEYLDSAVIMKAIKRSVFDPTKSYIITGGLGGVGLEIADWLIKRGANKLILTSRTGISNNYQKFVIDRWIENGVEVVIASNDLSTKENTMDLVVKATKLGPLGGVFHLAMVLRDAALENMTVDMFKQSCAAKVTGTLNLDEVTRKQYPPLDYFVCFSSVSSGRGNAGQTNYGFANSTMERICEQRRKQGYHGLCIQWGAIGDVGVVAEQFGGNDVVIDHTLPQRIPSCLDALDRLMQAEHAVVSSSVRVDNSKQSSAGKSGLFAQICHVLGVRDGSSLVGDVKLSAIGLDSLMVVEIKQVLEQGYEVTLTTKEIRELTVDQVKQMEADLSAVGKADKKETDLSKFKFSFASPSELFVTLNPNAERLSGRPIFLLPAIEGDFESLASLVTQVSRPAIGLNWTEELDAFESVEEVTQFYMNQMHETYPDTQYDLIGYSYGGLVAFEMANQLQKQFGDTYVKKVMLLDSSPRYVTTVTEALAAQYNYGLDVDSRLKLLLAMVSQFYNVSPNQTTLKAIMSSNKDEPIKAIAEFLTSQTNETITVDAVTTVVDRYFKKSKLVASYAPKRQFVGNMKLLRAIEVGMTISANLDETYDLSAVSLTCDVYICSRVQRKSNLSRT